MCQRSLGFVRDMFLCYRNLRCVRGVWDLSEICLEEFGVCQRSVSVLLECKVCQRSLGFVRDVFLCYRNLRCVRGIWGFFREVLPCYRNLRCVRGIWGLTEMCFCVIGI